LNILKSVGHCRSTRYFGRIMKKLRGFGKSSENFGSAMWKNSFLDKDCTKPNCNF
jgi:hypothetical protein